MCLTIKLIGDFFEQTSPEQMLMRQSGGECIRPEHSEIINSLRTQAGLSDPVINVLLQYVLLKNGKLVKEYVDEITVQWSKKHIKSVHEAMCLIHDETKPLFCQRYGISEEDLVGE
ncbi:DnaD domain protein [Peribacillus glennii]|uniref:DnaB/C C-terminal domain-containing protein n=1 Tax=Peribacillus glennii TaxID=2303991 RepID=A0A372L8M2_9BACI|nr:DnaD domain protein [Peribacillus glennii]RFU61792.1 hypothetical protein D0466_16780 [Peribacillus glennii]